MNNNYNSGISSGNESDAATTTATGGLMSSSAARTVEDKLTLSFPRVAKFPESVNKPNFTMGGLRDGRMYEEEVPLAKVSFVDCRLIWVCCLTCMY